MVKMPFPNIGKAIFECIVPLSVLPLVIFAITLGINLMYYETLIQPSFLVFLIIPLFTYPHLPCRSFINVLAASKDSICQQVCQQVSSLYCITKATVLK